MKEWTPEARQRLDNYLDELKRWAEASGQDGAEITEGIRSHVEAELNEAPGEPVTEEMLQRKLAALGAAQEIIAPDMKPADASGDSAWKRSSKGQILGLVRIFPLLTLCTAIFAILFEFVVGIMSELYIDPMPDLGHLAGLILIVVGLGLGDDFRKKEADRIGDWFKSWVYILNGFAVVLSFLYFLVYVPVLPLAAICCLVLLGFMGFAPLMCFMLSVVQLSQLWDRCGELGVTRAWALKRMALGVVLVGALVGPSHIRSAVTEWAVRKALSDNVQAQIQGQWWLKRLGNVESLVHSASGRFPGMDFDGDANMSRWSLYYKITGKSPRLASTQSVSPLWRSPLHLIDVHAQRAVDPCLLSSTMDGAVDTGTATAYLEWTLEFRNEQEWDQSVLGHIRLPYGAVGSRLTLWVNGEPCEAAYGTRNQAVQAYRDVAISQRRDPALLTVSGSNSVALECFPVPSHGTLKVKVGFTIPLELCDSSAVLTLPFFEGRTFDRPDSVCRSIWIESRAPMETGIPGIEVETRADGRTVLQGKVPEIQFEQPGTAIIRIPQAIAVPASADSALSETRATVHLDAGQAVTPALCLIIDGSVGMAEAMAKMDWNALIEALPTGSQIRAIQTGPLPRVWKEEFAPPSPELVAWLKGLTYEGGQDPAPALEKAWEWAAGQANGAILWVHDALPIELSSVEGLQQRMRRQPQSANGAPIVLYALGYTSENNVVMEKLDTAPMIRPLPILSDAKETSSHAVRQIAGALPRARYELLPNGPADGPASPDKGHGARLAVAERVRLMAWQGTPQEKAEATKLAMSNRLVTPLSGAVVLQTAQQYKDHNLNPSNDLDAVPIVPEPEEWALIAVAFLAATVAWSRHRKLGRAKT